MYTQKRKVGLYINNKLGKEKKLNTIYEKERYRARMDIRRSYNKFILNIISQLSVPLCAYEDNGN